MSHESSLEVENKAIREFTSTTSSRVQCSCFYLEDYFVLVVYQNMSFTALYIIYTRAWLVRSTTQLKLLATSSL
jgi:hypothetical protein